MPYVKRNAGGQVVGVFARPQPGVAEEFVEGDIVMHKSNKQTRDDALLALSYDFGDGRVIQTRPQDELNVRTAIEVMTDNGIASRDWVMIDNVKHPVTIAELEEAMAASKLKAVQIWDDYEPE